MRCRMDGIATFTMVASIDTMSRLRQHDARMISLRRWLSSPIVSFTQLLLNYNCWFGKSRGRSRTGQRPSIAA